MVTILIEEKDGYLQDLAVMLVYIPYTQLHLRKIYLAILPSPHFVSRGTFYCRTSRQYNAVFLSIMRRFSGVVCGGRRWGWGMICRLEKIHQWRGRTHHSLLQHLFPIHREPARLLLSENQSRVGQKIPFAVWYEAWTDDKRRQSRQWVFGTSKRRRRIVVMFIRRQIARSRNRSATIEDVNAGASSCNMSRSVLNRLC